MPKNYTATEVEEIVRDIGKIISLSGSPNCDYLNHKKSHYHKSGEECPVVKEINAALERLEKRLSAIIEQEK